MRFTYLFFSLLLCLTSYAQPNPINRRAMAIAGLASAINPSGALPAGMFLRWVASDVPLNNVVSNQWADRIQGVLLQQGDGTKQPTNSSSGVYFNGTWFLTNVAQSFNAGGGGFAVLAVVNQDVTTGSQMCITDSTFNGTGLPLFASGSATTFWSHGSVTTFSDLKFVNPGSTLHDILFCPTNGAQHSTCFTNGVATPCDISAISEQPNMIGFGREKSGTELYHGWLRELIVWTNATSMTFSSVNVSNIHWYATNTYSFTP